MSYGMDGWNKPDGDLISRAAALDAPEKYIKDCNPEHFVGHQKFIEFMDNAEIGSFGNWQFANGFNMGLTAAEVAIRKLPSAQPDVADTNVGDMISRQAALDACKNPEDGENAYAFGDDIEKRLMALPSAQHTDYSDGYADGYNQGLKDARPERLTDDDFETIRIHLNAHKEKLCNLHRWEEAEEYQRIINRFMSFASAQPERMRGRWIPISQAGIYECSVCGQIVMTGNIEVCSYCNGCGAKMEVSE